MPNRIPAAFCFDVEDLIAPETDDVSLWLADILTEQALTGTFVVVGEKARLWAQRGRQDVIEAVKRHHIAFHSTWHSVHPTTTEICLERDFDAGMHALRAWDETGLRDAERILGRPLLGWGCTGNSWSPSVMGLMGQMGRAYLYSRVRLPHHNVCWYANCLGFHGSGAGDFDAYYHDDALFADAMTHFQQEVETHLQTDWRGANWMCLFGGHPTRILSECFWDAVNFAKGANPPRDQWKPAPQHDPARIPTMQANFRKLCQFLREDSRIELLGWGDVIQRFDGQRAFMTQGELLETAKEIADTRAVLFTNHFTAGEILLMLCQAIVAPKPRYPRPTVYGPLRTPPSSTSHRHPVQALPTAAKRILEEATLKGYLPASVPLGDHKVGIGTLFVALAEAVLGQPMVSGPSDAPYPPIAEEVAREVAEALPDWPIHPENMDLSNLLQQTRLQCWTIKPAWERK